MTPSLDLVNYFPGAVMHLKDVKRTQMLPAEKWL
jgi:hypothetical protein